MARPRLVSDGDILEAARACFVEHGPNVSTAVIAEQLGISQAALFKRFGTKQQLLVASLLPPEVPPFIEIVEAGPDDRPLPDQLREITEAMGDFFVEITPRMAVMWASGLGVRNVMQCFDVPPPVRGLRALTGWFTRARDAGLVENCNPKANALMLMGSLQGRAFMTVLLGDVATTDLDNYASTLADTMWRGIAPKEAK